MNEEWVELVEGCLFGGFWCEGLGFGIGVEDVG